MSGVFTRLVGQSAVEAELVGAARAARGDSAHDVVATGTMTHAWLITGPPGSGRSVAAQCFAAALQCTAAGTPGCGECRSCTTTMAGTHGDVRRIVPEGLSIGVDEMRSIVQIASRRPSTGRWQIVVIEDADRLTEGAANALLKVVEEPPPSTVFLLCAPSVDPEDIAITLRSRCRHIALVTPPAAAPQPAEELTRSRAAIDGYNRTIVEQLALQWDSLSGPSCADDLQRAQAQVVDERGLDPLHQQALRTATRSHCRTT